MALAKEATRKERILDASIAAFEIREVCSYIAIKLAS
jgi:hypothetical protein